MTREEWKERLPLVRAFAEGETIEYRQNNGRWVSSDCMNFEDELGAYRIKPEPKLVPFTFEDNLVGKAIKHKEYPAKNLIIGQTDTCVRINDGYIFYSVLRDTFTFLDGSPCGKMEDE